MNLLYVIMNETYKGLVIQWDYKFNLIMEWLGMVSVIVGIMFFVGQGEITNEQATSSVLGVIITFYAFNAIGNMSWSLAEEAQTGTLEQLYMSPIPSQLILLGRSLSTYISATLEITFMTVVLFLLFQLEMTFTWEMIPVLLITIVGLMGLGYIMGGLTLVFKHIGPISNMVQNMMLFLNGTFLPVSLMPAWLATAVLFFPGTIGIILLRRVVLDGESLALLWADGSLIGLIIHSGITFMLGWIFYTVCENYARNQGSLGQY